MKPTISNAFTNGPANPAENVPQPMEDRANDAFTSPEQDALPWKKKANPHKSLAASLSPMQADLRETDFGWSLDLSPMQAVDVLSGLNCGPDSGLAVQFLVSMEQSAWLEGETAMSIGEIARRLAIPVIEAFSDDQIVLDETALRQLASLCQTSRLVAIAVEGDIDQRDARAMTRALEDGRSPLLVELRAVAALEVLGDRSLVLHCRSRDFALNLVAENFRHYLAALTNKPAGTFEAPQTWQLERLLSLTGMMTIRPIETQVFSTSIDVGINSAKERYSQPADRSLIYDIPSNSWHDEP